MAERDRREFLKKSTSTGLAVSGVLTGTANALADSMDPVRNSADAEEVWTHSATDGLDSYPAPDEVVTMTTKYYGSHYWEAREVWRHDISVSTCLRHGEGLIDKARGEVMTPQNNVEIDAPSQGRYMAASPSPNEKPDYQIVVEESVDTVLQMMSDLYSVRRAIDEVMDRIGEPSHDSGTETKYQFGENYQGGWFDDLIHQSELYRRLWIEDHREGACQDVNGRFTAKVIHVDYHDKEWTYIEETDTFQIRAADAIDGCDNISSLQPTSMPPKLKSAINLREVPIEKAKTVPPHQVKSADVDTVYEATFPTGP